MGDEAKLGLVAGVLAVIGVAAFGVPREPAKPAPAPMVQTRNEVPAPTPSYVGIPTIPVATPTALSK